MAAVEFRRCCKFFVGLGGAAFSFEDTAKNVMRRRCIWSDGQHDAKLALGVGILLQVVVRFRKFEVSFRVVGLQFRRAYEKRQALIGVLLFAKQQPQIEVGLAVAVRRFLFPFNGLTIRGYRILIASLLLESEAEICFSGNVFGLELQAHGEGFDRVIVAVFVEARAPQVVPGELVGRFKMGDFQEKIVRIFIVFEQDIICPNRHQIVRSGLAVFRGHCVLIQGVGCFLFAEKRVGEKEVGIRGIGMILEVFANRKFGSGVFVSREMSTRFIQRSFSLCLKRPACDEHGDGNDQTKCTLQKGQSAERRETLQVSRNPWLCYDVRVHRGHYILLAIFIAGTLIASTQQPKAPSVETLYAQAQNAQQRGNLDDAIAAYKELIKLYPQTAAAYNNLGSLFYDSGDYKQAIETVQAGLRLDRNMASSHAILGSAYRATGDLRQAAAEFKVALQKNPKDERSEENLVETLTELKEYPAAAALLRAKVEKEPNNQDAWRQLGDIYLVMSQDAHAKVLAIDPNSAIALDLLGEIQEGMGNYQNAQAKYEEAVRKDPDKPGTHEHLGNILWVQGLWSQAEKEFRAELGNNPSDCRAQWKLGNTILNESGDSTDALHVLSQAIQSCPTLMTARVDRARALIDGGHAEEALADLKLAEQATPDEAQIHFLLAKVYRSEGRASDAAVEMQVFGKLTDRGKHLTGAPDSLTPEPK